MIDFPKFRCKFVEYFHLVTAHEPKFGFFFAITCFKLLSCPFPLLFSMSFYSCYLLRFTFFLAVPKSWVLAKDKVWKWDLINYRYNGPFYDHFCTTTDNVDFQFATSQCRQNLKPTIVQIDLSYLYHLLIKNVR